MTDHHPSTRTSLFQHGRYTLDWVYDFYDQTGVWWGPNADYDIYAGRVEIVRRLRGPGPWRILDLGAGPGGTAAALADAGHDVVAVEFSPTRAAFAHELARVPRPGALTVVEADFYTVELDGRFDLVTYWDGFGIGADADQRRILRRIAGWLAPQGAALLDVFSPFRPAHDAGTEERLAPLPGVPGSVEMIRRCHFDAVQCRWTDEWIPTAAPERALAQTIRCYSPADLLLLLEGTGLVARCMEVEGEPFDFDPATISSENRLATDWSYLVMLATEKG